MPPGPIESDREARETLEHMRGGPGSVLVRHFRFEGKGAPTRFLILEIPPGAAEGNHVHYADDRNGTGAYEEFYYVISGRGLATLGVETYPVAAGDYWHAPLDMARGLANADPAEVLKVHLTVVLRDPARTGPA
ncbi:cupin domain-containing protein [Novosphingobium sp.]|uniref:cupin domain-containing protein n=1 Tax=Novosphingobium sp. TaxID=1874826 RepID=UPI003BA8D44B